MFTDEQLAELVRRFEEADAPVARAAHRAAREVRRLLSRRARIRLWRHGLVTSAGAWLCDHGCWRAARVLWRIPGLRSGR